MSRLRAWTRDSATLTRLYRELASEGITILMSTHDMLAARESCSRLCGVRGNIHLDGPADSFSLEQLHTWLHGHDIEEAQGHARSGLHLCRWCVG